MEQNELFSYDEFLINEAKKAKIKRKYTDKYPETTVQYKTPVRNKILSFISEKEITTKEQLVEFINGMNEETGRKTSFDWVRRNKKLIEKITNKDGSVSYKLTKFGKKVLSKTTISETDAATQQNTPGMGNVKAPSKSETGSGDIFDDEDKKKKRKRNEKNSTYF